MRASALILIVLLAFLFTPIPHAISAAPARLATVSGTLSPNETKDFNYTLARDLEDFLLHVIVTASAPQTDRLDITIEGATWTDLQGNWWDAWGRYTFGPLTAGDHTLTAATSLDAAHPVTFTVEFYEIPTTPFTVQGTFPAEPVNDIAFVHVSLPQAGNYSVSANANAGNFALIPEAPNEPINVTGATKDTLQIGEPGVYEFQVQADILGKNEATAWSLTIGSPTSKPSLHLGIAEGCTGIAPGSSCVFRANATASDGSHPSILYNWTASGGCFVNGTGGCVSSILGQNVNWTAPRGSSETTYTVTVNATADGYENGLATWPIVVPEFSSTGLALVISVASAAALILVGRQRKR
jgi:hypothetical protein